MFHEPTVSSVAKRTLLVQEVWGSIPGPVKSTQCRQRLATVETFLRSCVAQALSRGDGPRNSLHASAKYGEYNEGFENVSCQGPIQHFLREGRRGH